MLYLVVLFSAAAAVWLFPFIGQTRLPWLAAMVLAIGTVFGPPFFAIEGPIQISLERIAFVAVCVVGVVGLHGGSISRLPRLTTSDFLVAGMVVWFLISTVLGGAPAGKTNPMGTWIFYVLMPGLMYAVARISRFSEADLPRIESLLMALCGYLAVTAVLESRGLEALVFPRFISDPTNWEFLGRGRGPLLNPSANGIVITIGMTITLLRWLRAGRAGKVGYGLLLLVLLAGLQATLTRSVWIGAAVAIAIALWDETPRWAKVLSLATVVLLGGLFVTGMKEQLLRIKRDKNLSAAEAEKSVHLRPLLAIVAFEMFKDAPVAGHGFGQYPVHSRPYFSNRKYAMPLENARGYHQHNVLLSVLVDTGWVGLSLFGSLLVLWIRGGWRLAHTPSVKMLSRHWGLATVGSIAGYLVSGMFQDVMIMPMIQLYLFFLGGLLVTLSQSACPSIGTRLDRSYPRYDAVAVSPSLAATSLQENEVVGGASAPAAW